MGLYEIVTLMICMVYVKCDLVTGLVGTMLVLAQNRLVKFLYLADQGENAIFGGNMWTITLYLYLFGWTTQFIGHGVFEQRKPALLENIFFMLLGPFFMVFEVINMTTGYKQEELE